MLDFNQLLDFSLECFPPQISMTMNWVGMIILVIIGLIGMKLVQWALNNHHFRLKTIELSLPIGLSMEIQRNEATMYIANRIYVELMTRKAATLFDPEHDIIWDVYDSFYILFKGIREELKNIPGEYLNDYSSSRELLELGITILNNGLRPHLTKHQARYRTWHRIQEKKYPELPPQELQQKYPDYQALVEDLQAANRQMMQWTTTLEQLLKT
ncbi:MAG: hypothetical protein ACRBFS_01735 [Aureispira sp.]